MGRDLDVKFRTALDRHEARLVGRAVGHDNRQDEVLGFAVGQALLEIDG